jgi:hypothetical protein
VHGVAADLSAAPRRRRVDLGRRALLPPALRPRPGRPRAGGAVPAPADAHDRLQLRRARALLDRCAAPACPRPVSHPPSPAPGLAVAGYTGNFHRASDTDLALGTLDADKALCVALAHASARTRLDARAHAHLQCALLYTTAGGARRVRTVNVALQVAELAGSVFRLAYMFALVCDLARVCSSSVRPTLPVRVYSWLGPRYITDDVDEDVGHPGRLDRAVRSIAAGVQEELCGVDGAHTGRRVLCNGPGGLLIARYS